MPNIETLARQADRQAPVIRNLRPRQKLTWLGLRTWTPKHWAILLGLLAFLAGTNRWVSYERGFRLVQANDERDYRAIAVASPSFPKVKVQVQHAQRFVPHYLIGLIGHLAPIDTVYLVVALAASVFTTVLLGSVLIRLHLSLPVFALCLALFICNAYSLRYYGLAPAELADLLLDAAVLITIIGLIDRRPWLVLCGVAAGTLARQTMVPVAVAVALWIYFAPDWSAFTRSQRIGLGSLILATAAILYWLLVEISAPFSAHTLPGIAEYTFLTELGALPSGAGLLGEHFLRCFNALFSVIAGLVVGLISTNRHSAHDRRPFAVWGCLLIAAAIVAQPVVFSARYAQGNESRLAAMGLGALVCAVAYLLRDAAWLTRNVAALAILILAVGSFHHIYTAVRTHNAHQTVALQLGSALAVALVLAIALARDRTAHRGTVPS